MDYVRKLALYREAGVREYWIVDPKHEQVTVYDLEHEKEPVLYPFTERIKVGVYDDLCLDLENLHGTLQEMLVEEREDAVQPGRNCPLFCKRGIMGWILFVLCFTLSSRNSHIPLII